MIDAYYSYRSKIKTGDLLAWSQREHPFASWHNFQVWLVRLFRQSEYDHVGIAYWCDDETGTPRLYVIESVKPAPRKHLLSELLPVFHTPVKLHWTSMATALVCDYVYSGRYKYGTWDAILSPFGWNKRDNVRIECAELVGNILRACGVHLDCKDTPDEVVRAVQELGGATRLLLKEEAYL